MDIFKKHSFFIGSILVVVLVLLIARNYQKSSNQMIGKVKTPATGSVQVDVPDSAQVQDPTTIKASLEGLTEFPFVGPSFPILRINLQPDKNTPAKLTQLALQMRFDKTVKLTSPLSFILMDYQGNPFGSTVTVSSISSITPLIFSNLAFPINTKAPNIYVCLVKPSSEFFDAIPSAIFIDKNPPIIINPLTQKNYTIQLPDQTTYVAITKYQ